MLQLSWILNSHATMAIVRCLYIKLFDDYLSSLRAATLNKRLNIQRRLAWSLCKDDTHNRREANPFFLHLTLEICRMERGLLCKCETNDEKKRILFPQLSLDRQRTALSVTSLQLCLCCNGHIQTCSFAIPKCDSDIVVNLFWPTFSRKVMSIAVSSFRFSTRAAIVFLQ